MIRRLKISSNEILSSYTIFEFIFETHDWLSRAERMRSDVRIGFRQSLVNG